MVPGVACLRSRRRGRASSWLLRPLSPAINLKSFRPRPSGDARQSESPLLPLPAGDLALRPVSLQCRPSIPGIRRPGSRGRDKKKKKKNGRLPLPTRCAAASFLPPPSATKYTTILRTPGGALRLSRALRRLHPASVHLAAVTPPLRFPPPPSLDCSISFSQFCKTYISLRDRFGYSNIVPLSSHFFSPPRPVECRTRLFWLESGHTHTRTPLAPDQPLVAWRDFVRSPRKPKQTGMVRCLLPLVRCFIFRHTCQRCLASSQPIRSATDRRSQVVARPVTLPIDYPHSLPTPICSAPRFARRRDCPAIFVSLLSRSLFARNL